MPNTESSSPQLLTERLLIRLPVSSDAAALCHFVTNNRQHFAPWDPQRDEAYFTVDHWQQEIALIERGAQAGQSIHLAMFARDDGRVVGRCNLSGIIRGAFHAAYLGYNLDEAEVGKGVMCEALRAVISHAFGTMNLHRIMANFMPANERSARLLRRLGFVPEGYARDYLFLAGAWQDHVLTALSNADWLQT